MATKRMLSKSFVEDDRFLRMPSSSQNLYFHLLVRADDDGFMNGAYSTMMLLGAKDDDMNVLIAKKYVIAFQSGVIVIRHWKLHNTIKNDRYTPTKFKEEVAQLFVNTDQAYELIDKMAVS